MMSYRIPLISYENYSGKFRKFVAIGPNGENISGKLKYGPKLLEFLPETAPQTQPAIPATNSA
jgi:hypothetical protein